LFNNWFGLDQQLSKAMIAAALCSSRSDQHGPRAHECRRRRWSSLDGRLGGAGVQEAPRAHPATSSPRCGWPPPGDDRRCRRRVFRGPRASLGQYIATYSAFLNFERSPPSFPCAIGIGLYVAVIVEWLLDALTTLEDGVELTLDQRPIMSQLPISTGPRVR
jgi:hypothetical protein